MQCLYKEKYQLLPINSWLYNIKQIKYTLFQLHPTEPSRLIIQDVYKKIMLTILSLRLLLLSGRPVRIEYLPHKKWKTLDTKDLIDNQDSLMISWIQMSIQDLIVKGKSAIKPFWTDKCLDISRKLWLPETSGNDTFWNVSSDTKPTNSWFSIQQKNNPTNTPSQYMFINTIIHENEGIRVRKIRLYPTTQQKLTIKKWMDTRRYVYNKAIAKVKEGEKINFFKLRDMLVTAKNNTTIKDWELETPAHIRAGAVSDMVKNYTTAFSNLKNMNIKGFNMGFCKKKDEPSIEIQKTGITIDKGLYLFKRYMPTKVKIASGEKLDFPIDYDCRLQIKYGIWYLVVPIKRHNKVVSDKKEWCSLDPGVRTFQTVYSEEEVFQIKIKKEAIKKLQIKLDKFKSLRARKIISPSRKRRQQGRIYTRLNNLVDDLHHKTCAILTSIYNTIILPKFESQEMVKKSRNKNMNRNLLQLKHYKFKERLRSKCQLSGCTLEICTEEYTSQTCGACGKLTKIGSSEVYVCSNCGIHIDRDVNGARNIGIKHIKEISQKSL